MVSTHPSGLAGSARSEFYELIGSGTADFVDDRYAFYFDDLDHVAIACLADGEDWVLPKAFGSEFSVGGSGFPELVDHFLLGGRTVCIVHIPSNANLPNIRKGEILSQHLAALRHEKAPEILRAFNERLLQMLSLPGIAG